MTCNAEADSIKVDNKSYRFKDLINKCEFKPKVYFNFALILYHGV